MVDYTNPTFGIRHVLTAALGMHIAMEDAQGTISFFFHERQKKKGGKTSDRVLGVSNKHVLL